MLAIEQVDEQAGDFDQHAGDVLQPRQQRRVMDGLQLSGLLVDVTRSRVHPSRGGRWGRDHGHDVSVPLGARTRTSTITTILSRNRWRPPSNRLGFQACLACGHSGGSRSSRHRRIGFPEELEK